MPSENRSSEATQHGNPSSNCLVAFCCQPCRGWLGSGSSRPSGGVRDNSKKKVCSICFCYIGSTAGDAECTSLAAVRCASRMVHTRGVAATRVVARVARPSTPCRCPANASARASTTVSPSTGVRKAETEGAQCSRPCFSEPVEESYPTPHIHEQMTASNYGYDNIMLEPNAMNNIDTVAHMNMHYTQY